ncbi:HD domain-containing protein [Gorillibacterium timonense]|uniref:HD domain-containing protein n=1 Tax=Gorillibacterium timonense TaxID=1689269 RepID=UPI0009E9C2E0|nr:HD domain-containing protein [Gorillibacterium timonense]
MATLTRAIVLAAKHHDGQKDKGNQPYLFHPLRLMLNALTEDEQIIAVLHDTIEDTDLTLEQLREEGFDERIVSAIDALSRRKKESYEDFILRIKQNSLARRVKILDLQDNMAPLRNRKKSSKDKDRLKKYSRALDTLLGGFPEPEPEEADPQAAEAILKPESVSYASLTAELEDAEKPSASLTGSVEETAEADLAPAAKTAADDVIGTAEPSDTAEEAAVEKLPPAKPRKRGPKGTAAKAAGLPADETVADAQDGAAGKPVVDAKDDSTEKAAVVEAKGESAKLAVTEATVAAEANRPPTKTRRRTAKGSAANADRAEFEAPTNTPAETLVETPATKRKPRTRRSTKA